jgi:hypothetical protein
MSAGRPRAMRAAGLALFGLLGLGGAGCAAHAAKNAAESVKESVRQSQANTPREQQITYIASQRAVEGAIAAFDQPAQRAQLQKIVDAAVAEAVASALRVALAPGAMPEAGGAEGPGGRGAAAILAGQIGRAATEDALQRVAFALGGDGALGQGVATTSARATDAAVGAALGRVASALGGDGVLGQGVVTTSAKATDAAVGAALGELFPECRGDDAAAAGCRRERVQALTRATAASLTAGVRDSLAWPLLFLAVAIGLLLGALVHWAVTLRRRRPHAFRHA